MVPPLFFWETTMKLRTIVAPVFLALIVDGCSSNGYLLQVPSLDECYRLAAKCYVVTPEGTLVYQPRKP